MDNVIGTIREFNTPNFRVVVDALEDYDTDLSFDETGEVLAKLESGEFVSFCARVRVIHTPSGKELGSDYLGGCIYESIEQFQDHRECGAQTRKLRAEGSNAVCGSYFSDMIGEAIKEAREFLDSLKPVTCGGCRAQWLEELDPAPAAMCHYCHGRGHSHAEVTAPDPEPEFRCSGCDRPELDCSRSPCPDVIADRGETDESDALQTVIDAAREYASPDTTTFPSKVKAAAILAAVALLSGCAAVLEHDARQCHREAVTVAQMTECHEQHPQHKGTITDKIAQPLGELERHLFRVKLPED